MSGPRYRLAAGCLAAEVAIQLAYFAAGDDGPRFLDSAWAYSYSHWLSALALAAGVAVGGYGALYGRSHRGAWLAIAAAHGFLLLDVGTRLHSHIGWWPLIYGPVFLALSAAALIVAGGSELAPVVRTGVLLLCAALAIHAVGPAIGRANDWGVAEGGPYPWPYQVIIALKEGVELAGWVLFTPALLYLARAKGEEDTHGALCEGPGRPLIRPFT